MRLQDLRMVTEDDLLKALAERFVRAAHQKAEIEFQNKSLRMDDEMLYKEAVTKAKEVIRKLEGHIYDMIYKK